MALRYKDGNVIIESWFKKKIICIKSIRSCNFDGNKMIIDSSEYGKVQLKTKKHGDLDAIKYLISHKSGNSLGFTLG